MKAKSRSTQAYTKDDIPQNSSSRKEGRESIREREREEKKEEGRREEKNKKRNTHLKRNCPKKQEQEHRSNFLDLELKA